MPGARRRRPSRRRCTARSTSSRSSGSSATATAPTAARSSTSCPAPRARPPPLLDVRHDLGDRERRARRRSPRHSALDDGFEIDIGHVTLVGRCRDCAAPRRPTRPLLALRRVRRTHRQSGFLGVPVETDPDRSSTPTSRSSASRMAGRTRGPGAPAGCADGSGRRPPSLAARLARFREHWDFDLDGPMRLRRRGSWMPATSPATPLTGRATRAGPRPRWRRSSSGAPCRSASAATTRCRSRSCVPSRVAARSPSCRSTRTSTSATRCRASARATPRRCAARPRWGTWSGSCRSGCAASVRRAPPTSRTPARPATCSSRRASSASVASHGCSSSCRAEASVFVAFDCDGLDPSRLAGRLRAGARRAQLRRGGRPAGRHRPAAGGRGIHRVRAGARRIWRIGAGGGAAARPPARGPGLRAQREGRPPFSQSRKPPCAPTR